MSVAVKSRQVEAPRSLGAAYGLTWMMMLLAVVASAGGLLMPDLYRDTAWVVPQNRGQDLVTLLVAVPALDVSLLAARRGSARGSLVWVGVLGYFVYTYTGAALAFALNPFYLIYVALFSLSIFTLVAAVSAVDAVALAGRFDAAVPRRPVAIFLSLIAFLLSVLWLRDILPFLTTGLLPQSVILSGGPTFFVYALDSD